MSRRRTTALTAALLLATLARPAAALPCDPHPAELRVTDQIVLVLRPAADVPDVEATLADLAARHPIAPAVPERSIPQLRAWLMTTTLTDPAAQAALIEDLQRNEPAIKHADLHWRFETPEGGQRNLPDLTRTITIDDVLNQTATSIVNAVPTGRRWTGAGVTVALVDTAASTTNPLTQDAIVGQGFDVLGGGATADVPSNGADDDADGLTDESEQHGAFAAGMAHLAAPGARLLHLRALDDDGHGDAFDVAEAIVLAAEAGARVINLSLGVTNELRILDTATDWAINERGIVLIASTGNRGQPCVDRPAANSTDGVIAVAAVDDALARADFSNFGVDDLGVDHVAVSAPGVDVLSAHGDGFAAWSGTSFAAPLVSGGAAVLLEKYPELTPAEVKAALMATAQPYPLPETGMGAGVLDLGALQVHEGPFRGSLRLRKSPADVLASWSPVAGATAHDLARGEIRNLAVVAGAVDLGPLTCLREDWPGAPVAEPLADPDPVPPGGFFYLLRDDAPDAAGGSYGASSTGLPRLPGALDCAP